MILGIDEVGRGPWAGPLVVCAVVLNGALVEGLTDSKKLTKKRRGELYDNLVTSEASIGLGRVHADELDKIGLSRSLIEASKRAVRQINVPYHEIIIDGTVNFLKDTSKGKYVTTLKKADLLVPSVSAASIIAKVARDTFMEQQHELYPEYGFERHVGYGTAAHRAMIDAYGLTPLHRRSFGPLKSIDTIAGINETVRTMTTIGNMGEDAACTYLAEHEFDFVDRNWKTRACEIDIVATKHGVMYFIEVKYRKHYGAGDGLSAITLKKLKQMTFAARMYAHFNRVSIPLQLAAISVSGEPARVMSYVEID